MDDSTAQVGEQSEFPRSPTLLATTATDGGSACFAGATNRSIPILGQAPGSNSPKG